MSHPRTSGRFKIQGIWPEDRRYFGVLLSRRARAIERAALHKELTAPDSPEPTTQLCREDYVSPPEHMRNCELPRCPVCHWADKGWGTEQEAIASWRTANA